MSPVEVLFAASASDYGVVVEEASASNLTLLREKLYAARRAQSPTFDHISITTSPTSSTELWVVNRLKELEREAG